VEFLPTGKVYAPEIQLRSFMPNIYEDNSSIFVADLFRLLFMVILFFFLVIDMKNRLQTFPQNPEEWISVKQAVSIFILVLYLISFIIKMVYLENKSADYYNTSNDVFNDSYTIAFWYNQVFFIESLLFEGVSIKILDFLILNDNIKLFFDCINVGVKTFFKYMLLIILIFLFYSIIGYMLYGPFIAEFKTYQQSFASILLISVGYFDLRQLIHYNQGWGTFYILTFFIVVILFLNIVLISLFAEGLKKAVVQVGYPDDYDDTQWQFKDYIVWLCHFVETEDEKQIQ
jgi:hypothetical protein